MANPWDTDPIVNAGPVYGAPPKPDIPSGYAGDASGLHPIPGGPADKTQPSPPSGYRFHGSNLEAIPGGPADKKANGDQLSQEALDAETTNWILTGKMSPFGMGNGPLRVQIQNNRPIIMHKYGISDNQLPAIQQQFSADAKAYSQRTQQLSFMKQAADAAKQHVEQISGYLSQLPAQGNATPLNALSLGAQRAMSGETITNLDATIPLLQAEVAKVMTANPSGSGQLTDEARREFAILNSARSPHAKMLAMQALMEMIDRKIGGTQSESDRLNQHINGGLASYAAGSAGPGAPPSSGSGGQPPPLPTDKLGPATGSTKETIDPNLTPVRREYMSRLNAGQSGAQLVSFLRQAGVSDPSLLKRAQDQAAFRRKNPNVPIQQYDTSAIDHITQRMGLVNRAVNAAGQTDAGAAAIAAGNGALANYGPDLVGALGGNEMQARLATQQSAQDHPGSALAGGIVGGTAAAMAGEAALARGAGVAPGFARSLLADSGYGAVAGSGASPDNRGGGAALGAMAGAAGSVGGQALARGGGAALSGVKNANVNALLGSDIPLTVGQAVGGGMKSIEDRLTSFVPGIAARRQEGYRVFNRKAFDKALEPIGQTVGNQTGEEAVASARGAVSQAFQSALRGKSAVPDAQFVGQAKTALGRLAAIKRNDLGQEIVGQIEESTKDLFDPKTGAISGENMQTFLEGLRQIKQAYRNDPLSNGVISPAIKQIEKSVEGMFERQAPEVMPAYKAAKGAYRRVSILADAVDKGKNTDGLFTPAQLGMADRANAKRLTGAMNASSGGTPFHDLQRAAQNVLPSKVPDSGTAGRAALLAVPGAIAASGGGVGYAAGDGRTGAETGLGLAGMLALLYTKRGQTFLVNAAVRRGAKSKAAGSALQRAAPYFGAAGASVPGAISDQ